MQTHVSPIKTEAIWFEVLTMVVMKSSVFWDTTSCRPLKVSRNFGGTYRLHLQSRRVCLVRNQHEADSNALLLNFIRTHSVMSQKTELKREILFVAAWLLFSELTSNRPDDCDISFWLRRRIVCIRMGHKAGPCTATFNDLLCLNCAELLCF
jgi:hypothetical protein